jgi:hypothetical protein
MSYTESAGTRIRRWVADMFGFKGSRNITSWAVAGGVAYYFIYLPEQRRAQEILVRRICSSASGFSCCACCNPVSVPLIALIISSRHSHIHCQLCNEVTSHDWSLVHQPVLCLLWVTYWAVPLCATAPGSKKRGLQHAVLFCAVQRCCQTYLLRSCSLCKLQL